MNKFIAGLALAATGLAGGLGVWPGMATAQEGQIRGAPRGDYNDHCQGSYVNLGRLYADCRDNRGRMRSTSIELARCSSSEIRADNGLLVCGRHRGDFEEQGSGGGHRPPGPPPGGHYPPGPPPGSGHHPGGGHRPPGSGGGGWGGGRFITVYEHADFRGRSLRLDEGISNLKDAGMNDRISSIQTRGQWEVCVDADFRGRCVIINNDVANLKRLGMNDSISSIRPVRRR